MNTEEKPKQLVGRPRKTSFSPEEMQLLGQEMIEWLKNHPETLHLSEWYTIEKMFLYREWKTFIQREEFIPYYEQALKLIGLKYLKKDSNVRDGISQRWQRVYFKDLKEEEDETAEFNSALKVKEIKTYTENDERRANAVIEAIDNARKELHSTSNIAVSNNNKE